MDNAAANQDLPFIPFMRPEIGEPEIESVCEVLRSGWLTTGKWVQRFEQAFAKYVGAKHAIAVNSATSGLHLGLDALGIGPGDKVLTTPYTFTATGEVIRYQGADPVFVDIDPRTLNIDVGQMAEALQNVPGIKAMIPVHMAGQACRMKEILALSEQYGVPILEDAAHALPASTLGRRVGTIGDITAFSFYVTKTITTGEGGMVTTDDDAYAKRMKTMRLHGIDRDVFSRYTTRKPSWYYEVVAPGYKYNLTDIAAAIGVHQLAKCDRMANDRRALAVRYNEAFVDLPVELPQVENPEDEHAWHLYILHLKLDALRISRDTFIEKLSERNIGASVHFIPLHFHPYWQESCGLNEASFPQATAAFSRVVSLPLYPGMSEEEFQRVITAVREILLENLA
ncbi:MAG: dTDP-4-amino-4,6-dideoxygalactose transaminase [Kiritimatiellia bacterium]|jgi:dTDP-4-amino-4,6-dideoxygalactose transaminase